MRLRTFLCALLLCLGLSAGEAYAQCSPSAQGATVSTVGPTICDSISEAFSITSGGQVAVNGTTDGTTSGVILLLYWNNLVYQENNASNWYYKANAAATWAGPTTDPRIQPGQAVRTNDFLNSIGVNNHVEFGGTPEDNPTVVIAAMQYAGITYSRENAPEFANSDLNQVAQAGIIMDMIGAPAGQDVTTTLPNDLSGVALVAQSKPGSIFAFEGPNELNGQIVYYNGAPSSSASTAAQIQQFDWNTIMGGGNSNANYLTGQGMKVAQLSVFTGSGNWQSFVTGLGNLSAYDNYANFHEYPGPNPPRAYMAQGINYAKQISPGNPVWITETGLCTAQANANVQMYENMDIYLDDYQLGAQKTYIYMLTQIVFNNSNPTDCESTYGMVILNGGTSWTPQPALTALHNQHAILFDTASNSTTFIPTALNYTISNLPATAYSMMMEKANGTFELAIWNEPQLWNGSSENTITPVNITVNLPQTVTTAHVFDPTLSSTAQSTYSNVTSVTIPLAEHPLILEMIPSSVPVTSTAWNPGDTSANGALSNSNKTLTLTSSTQGGSRSTTSQSGGQYCFAVTANTISTNLSVGIANSNFSLAGTLALGYDANGTGFFPNATSLNQTVYYNGAQTLFPGTGPDVNGDEIDICADFTNNLMYASTPVMRSQGITWNNWTGANPVTQSGGAYFSGLTCPCYIAVTANTSGTQVTLNPTGPFAVALPSGFAPWQTAVSIMHHPTQNNLGLNVPMRVPPFRQPSNDNTLSQFYIPVDFGRTGTK